MVNIGQYYSIEKNVSLGIPQGSILGPTIFKIFVNDIFALPWKGKIQLYADDIIIMYGSSSLHELFMNMQTDLHLLDEFLCENNLILNCEKTKYILFENKFVDPSIKSAYQLKYRNKTIEEVKTYNYLGLIVDSKLKWNLHIEKQTKCILPYIFALYKTKRVLPRSILTKIYNSYILSQLIYLNPIWSGAPQYLVNKLYILQKRAIKNILNVHIQTPTVLIFQNFMSLPNIIKRELLMIAFKITNGLIKHNVDLVRVSDIHSHDTRRNSLFRNNRFLSHSSNNNVIYRCLDLFNKLPPELRHETNISKYKAKISEFIITCKWN